MIIGLWLSLNHIYAGMMECRHSGLKNQWQICRAGSVTATGTTLEAIQTTWVLHKYSLGVRCYIYNTK